MERKIIVTVKKNYRSFSEGYTVTLDYNDENTIYLMGRNGCGKSTLIQAIRGKNNSNKDAIKKWNAKNVCYDILDSFNVEIDGFDKIYHLDVDGLDNATSMWNSADVSGFIDFGGWETRSLSAGEKSIVMFSKLKVDIEDGENTLIVFDELDGHLDTEMTLKFPKLLNKLFPNSKKLIVTHNILMGTINDGNIVYMDSDRDTKNWKQCNLCGNEPHIYDSKTKELKFRDFTKCSLSKLKDETHYEK